MADEITNEQIAELRRLHEAATPPERFSVTRYGHGGGRVCAEPRDLVADFYSEADRECWIAARNALPALIARVATLEAIVEKCQWASAPFRDEALCPCCGGRRPLPGDTVGKNGFGHSDDCEIASALRGLEGK